MIPKPQRSAPCSLSSLQSSSARSGSFSAVRQRGTRRRISRRRHRTARGVAGVRSDGGDRGVRVRPDLGGHFNPAVSVGLWAGGRFPAGLLLPYIVAQVVGGIAGAGVLYLIASGRADFSLAGGFASNGYDAHSPGGYSLAAGLVCEVVMTFMFLIIILGTTHQRAPVGFAGLAIGLGLTLIHLISIPVTNTSVNPARSTATALFVGGWALQQLWLFWLAPMVGAAIAGFVSRTLLESSVVEPPVIGRAAA